MRILGRILITVVVTFTVIFVCVSWVGPVALSFYAARKVPAVAKVVPTDLKDKSVSDAPGAKLSYFGYEFEIPWNDLDETQTKLYPKDKPEKTTAVLTFRSGLRLQIKALPPHEWTSSSDPEMKAVPLVVAANFGSKAVSSDYSLVKAIYNFTPKCMHYWALPARVHYREQMILVFKSIMLAAAADTGIFNIQNQSFKGFQQGDPQARQSRLVMELYSDEGSVEFVFFEEDYKNSAGVTQPEISRIVQTLRKIAVNSPSAHQIAAK